MKNRSFLCGAALAASAWSAPALAQDKAGTVKDEADRSIRIASASILASDAILVSANRDGDGPTVSSYPGSATIVEREQIEQRQVRDIADVLRDVPGIAVSAVAGQTQLRLRGSEGNHVLVLVDGIEVSDPFAGEFDVGSLQAEIGSYVEVLRGPQSALYGSDAIGGVVAYQSGDFNGFAARVEAGSHNTINGAARFGTSGDGWRFSLSTSVVSTDGEPNARAINGGGTRDIGRDSYTFAGRGQIDLSTDLTIRAVARYVLTDGDFNNQDFESTSPTFGLVIDSPGTRYENEAIYALVGAELRTLDQRWTHDLSFQIADISRDSFGPFGRSFGNEGERLKASYVSSLKFSDAAGLRHALTFAADWEEERYRNTDPFGFAFTGTRTNENVGLVGEYQIQSRLFQASAAIRHDINDNFADTTTFKLAAGFGLTDTTRLRGAVGTGIKNPGFYELFGFVDGRFIGNADLKPEKSTGWEVGLEQDLFAGLANLSLTYFEDELEGEIFTAFPAPDFIATPANRTTESHRKGVELAARAKLGPQVTFDASYTWLDAEENGVEEVRRPGDIASAALNWTAPEDAASATLVVRYNGETDDLAFTNPSFIPVTERLDDFVLVNVYGEVRLFGDVRLFARGENLLDESYEQVFSFVSPGRTATVGVKASF